MYKGIVLQAVSDTLSYLGNNGVTIEFSEGHFYVYVNWTNRSISIHKAPKGVLGESSADVSDYFIKSTAHGGWIGPFRNFAEAYTFASLLKKALLYYTHEEACLSTVKMVNVPYRFL